MGHERMGDVEVGLADEPDIAVDAAMVAEVEAYERFAGRDERVDPVVGAHEDGIAALVEVGRGVDDEGCEASGVLHGVAAVDPDVGELHDALKLDPHLPREVLAVHIERPAIVADALPGMDDGERFDISRVRERHVLPGGRREHLLLRPDERIAERIRAMALAALCLEGKLRLPRRALPGRPPERSIAVEADELPAVVHQRLLSRSRHGRDYHHKQ